MITTPKVKIHSRQVPSPQTDKYSKIKQDARVSGKVAAAPSGVVHAFGIGNKKSGQEERRESFSNKNKSLSLDNLRIVSKLQRELHQANIISVDKNLNTDVVPLRTPASGSVTSQEPTDEIAGLPETRFSRKQADYRRLNQRRWLRAQGQFASPLLQERKELNALGKAIGKLTLSTELADLFNQDELAHASELLDSLQKRVHSMVKNSDKVSSAYFQKARAKEVSSGIADGAYERTDAIGFKEAYFEAKELYALSQSLLQSIQKKIDATVVLPKWANWTRGGEKKEDGNKNIIDKLYALNLIFDAKSKWYLAKASEADLAAHANYQKAHALKQLDGAKSGSYVVQHDVNKANFGAAVEMGPLVGGAVGVGLHSNSTNAVSYGHDGTVDQTVIKGGGVSVDAKLSAKLVASVKANIAYDESHKGYYFEVEQNSKALDYISTNHVLYKNEERVLPPKLLLNPSVQSAYHALRNVKNTVGRFWGFDPKNPYMPIYTTKDVLGEAQGVQMILQEAYRSLGVRHRAIGKFDANQVLPLSLPAPASIPGTAKPTQTPWHNRAISGNVSANVGTSTIYKPPVPGIVPTIGASVEAGGSVSSLEFDGVLLKSAHELLSVAHTRSLAESQKLLKNTIQKVWVEKSDGIAQSLPAHIQATYHLFKNQQTPATHLSEEAAIDRLTQATTMINELAESFASFEKIAPNFYEAVTHRKQNQFSAQRYSDLKTLFSGYQLNADRLPSGRKYNSAMALEAVGRVWDSYSIALGGIELLSLTPILKQQAGKPLSPEMSAAIESFNHQYKALAHAISNPSLPMIKDSLYRHGSILAQGNVQKISKEVKAAISAGVEVPSLLHGTNLGLPDETGKPSYSFGSHIFGGLKKNIKRTKTHVKTVPNPLRQGDFDIHTRTGQLSSPVGRLPFLKQGNSEFFAEAENTQSDLAHDLAVALAISEGVFSVSHSMVWRNGELQNVGHGLADTKIASAGTPNFLGALGAKLTMSAAKSTTKNAQHTLMGSELAYHILQFPELLKNGISFKEIEEIKTLLNAADDEDKTQLQDKFTHFFKTLKDDKKIQLTYFGLNGIGTLLHNFSEVQHTDVVARNEDHGFAFVGMDVFKKEITQKYFERLQESRYSVNKFSSDKDLISVDDDIFKYIGVTPSQVKALLQQLLVSTDMTQDGALMKHPQQTVSAFLANANAEQRAKFFQDDLRGQQLWAAYVLIVNGANDIRKEFFDFPLSVSKFAQKTQSTK